MPIKIHILNTSSRLTQHIILLKKETKRSIHLIKKYLPINQVDVVLYENPLSAIQEIGGIGGYAPTENTVLISLDTQHPDFAKAIQTQLLGTMAHEFHHVLRRRGPGYGTTLREALITEGLADHFDLQVTQAQPRPWSRALTNRQIKKALEQARPLFNKPYNHEAWFFGSKKEGIPRWTGYALGFYLVDQFLKNHPEQKPSQLYSKPAIEFI